MAPLPTIPVDVLSDDALDNAYEAFWHAAEDDLGVTSFGSDEADTLSDADDVYYAFVAAVEA